MAAVAAATGVEAILEIVAQGPQQRFIRPGMQPPYAVIFVLIFDQAQAPLPGFGNYPDAPLRGLYARNRVYEGVTDMESFAPWTERVDYFR